MKIPLLVIILLSAPLAFAWDDCPYGLINDSAPGSCGRYVDANLDSICDHSQPESIEQTTESAELEPALAERNPTVAGSAPTGSSPLPLGQSVQQAPVLPRYDLVPISAGLLFIYGLSFAISRKNPQRIVMHRRLWNTLLLLTFLASALLGVLMVIRINTGYVVRLPFDTLFWHVEAGIAMTAISVFHIAWHWRYFRNLLNFGRRECSP